MAAGWILVLNAGSSSLKFASFDRQSLTPLAAGQVAQIGGNAEVHFGNSKQRISAPDHGAALSVALEKLSSLEGPPSGVGHRVVHGGALTQPALITPEIYEHIKRFGSMAPLHNPAALKVIDALTGLYPDIAQIACFDTAFHAGNPLEATTFALPLALRNKGLHRYGFHGLSYASLTRRFSDLTGKPLPKRLLAFHLGAGASIAAIVSGKGVATTMGFSPLDGLTMATRAGSLDPGLILHMLDPDGENMEHGELAAMLNHDAGLKALAAEPEMKALLLREDSDAKFAVSHFVYWASRHAGSMIAAMQGLDGIVFTGGIGENAAPVRQQILQNLRWAGLDHAQKVWVIKADEEGEIAQSVINVVQRPA